ncbi:MAG: hypothetical protein FIA91_02325 [Geobacter sp.]|nr:hypothetical protein [Geobacter sp.]
MAKPLRKSGLFSAEVDEQTLIYDATNNRTHCLNPQALKVWQLCNGLHSRDDMVLALRTAGHDVATQPGDAEDLVDAALGRFTELEMLETGTLMTRRDFGKAALKGLAAGLVLSVMMPTRAMAASGLTCEDYKDPITCVGFGCSWMDGSCETPSTGPLCSDLEEEQCNAATDCIWVGVCI